MKIAVIGDYSSPEYKSLLQIVAMSFPEDTVLDLSRHEGNVFKKNQNARQEDIKVAHIYVFDSNWDQSTVEVRQDITYAQMAGKDGYKHTRGQFHSFPCHSL